MLDAHRPAGACRTSPSAGRSPAAVKDQDCFDMKLFFEEMKTIQTLVFAMKVCSSNV